MSCPTGYDLLTPNLEFPRLLSLIWWGFDLPTVSKSLDHLCFIVVKRKGLCNKDCSVLIDCLAFFHLFPGLFVGKEGPMIHSGAVVGLASHR